MSRRFLTAAMLAVAATGVAHATEVRSLADATTYAVPPIGATGTGPQSFAPGIVWSSESAQSVFGYTGWYGFNGNGHWDGLSMIGSNSPAAAMRISFATPVSGAGLFLNYSADLGALAVIAAYDASGRLVESTTLAFTTDGSTNSGEFHGFQEPDADIAWLTLSGSYIGAANLETTSVIGVPEPATAALLAAGLGVLLLAAPRRRA